jgi:hypothetical protein
MNTLAPTAPRIGTDTDSAQHPIRQAARGHDEVEKLSAKFHLIHQEEARRQGEAGDVAIYDELEENAKEFFRVQARYILDHYFRR